MTLRGVLCRSAVLRTLRGVLYRTPLFCAWEAQICHFGVFGVHIAVSRLEDHTKSTVLFKSTMDHDDVIGEKVWKRKDACHIESDRIYSILRKSPFYLRIGRSDLSFLGPHSKQKPG